jgi:hypothetical protein
MKLNLQTERRTRVLRNLDGDIKQTKPLKPVQQYFSTGGSLTDGSYLMLSEQHQIKKTSPSWQQHHHQHRTFNLT